MGEERAGGNMDRAEGPPAEVSWESLMGTWGVITPHRQLSP